jgi:hypothetical protein
MFNPDNSSNYSPAAGAEQKDDQLGGKLSPGRQEVWEALIENVDVNASDGEITSAILGNLDRVAIMGLSPEKKAEAERIIAEVGGDEFFHQVRDAQYPSRARWEVFENLAKLLGKS